MRRPREKGQPRQQEQQQRKSKHFFFFFFFTHRPPSYFFFLAAALVVAASFLQKTSSKNEISPPPPPPKPLLRLEERALHPLSLAAAALAEAPPLPSSLAWPPPAVVRLFRRRHVSLIPELSPPGPQKKTPMCSSGCAALTRPWLVSFLFFFLSEFLLLLRLIFAYFPPPRPQSRAKHEKKWAH